MFSVPAFQCCFREATEAKFQTAVSRGVRLLNVLSNKHPSEAFISRTGKPEREINSGAWMRLTTVLAVLAILFTSPLLSRLENLGIRDWDQQLFYYGSFLKTVTVYGQFPFWNPWYCGGSVLLQNPQVPIFSPAFLLAPFVGLLIATKANIMLHYFLALLGIALIARKVYQISSTPVIIVTAAVFAFNSFFSLQIGEGHAWILSFAYIPFAFLGFELYLEHRRLSWLIFAAGFLALIVWSGGIYPAPLTALFFCFYTILRTALDRDTRALTALILMGGYAVLFAAPKLFPVLEYMYEYPRTVMDREYIPPAAWFDIFFGRDQSLHKIWLEKDGSWPMDPRMHWGWVEYGCYVGIPVVLVFGFALLRGVRLVTSDVGRSRYIALIGCFIAFFALFVGDFAWINPFRLLKQLPVASSLHVTGRFLIIVAFVGALVILECFSRFRIDKLRSSSARVFFAAVCIAIVADLILISQRPLKEAFTVTPDKFSEVTEGIRKESGYQMVVNLPSYGAFSTMYAALQADLAILQGLTVQPQCYEPLAPEIGYQQDRALVFSDNPNLSVSNIHFTPNRIRFDLEARTGGRVMLNQNFVRGWTFSEGRAETVELDNLPSSTLAAGSYQGLEFSFRPAGFFVGLLGWMFGIFLAVTHVLTTANLRKNVD